VIEERKEEGLPWKPICYERHRFILMNDFQYHLDYTIPYQPKNFFYPEVFDKIE
jgi:uncharacterized protein YcaQ